MSTRSLQPLAALSAPPDGCRADQPVAIDTEFVRERTFWPELALIQLRAGEHTHLLDPLGCAQSEALQTALAQASTVLMHAPGEDLECLAHSFGWLPPRLFDTQLAAAMVGHGVGLGYQALVLALLGIAVDKGETRSNWLQRPLTDSQLRYAADDVEHLHALHHRLAEQLIADGKQAWFEADCAGMLQRAGEDAVDPLPHLAFRAGGGLDRRAQIRLRRILLWREQQARRSNRPRAWIVDNELVAALAQAPDRDRARHDQLFARSKRAARHAPDALFDELAAPADEFEANMRIARRLDDGERAAVARMQEEVARLAEELALPAALLLARRHLEDYVETRRWPEGKRGWRQAQIEPRLAPLLPA